MTESDSEQCWLLQGSLLLLSFSIFPSICFFRSLSFLSLIHTSLLISYLFANVSFSPSRSTSLLNTHPMLPTPYAACIHMHTHLFLWFLDVQYTLHGTHRQECLDVVWAAAARALRFVVFHSDTYFLQVRCSHEY